IFTIGYEGASFADLVTALKKAGAVTLVDVRAVPWSRKHGFGKKDLAARLSGEGIDYLHLGALGNPEPGRRAAKEGRTGDYRRHLDAQLDGEAGQSALDMAARLART